MVEKKKQKTIYLLCFLIICCFLLPHFFQLVSSQKSEILDSETILVTGFEPWASHEVNPSELIANQLNGSMINEKIVYGAVLPVDFDVALQKLKKLIYEKQPVLIICLGLAPGTSVIKVESIGFNLFYDPYMENVFQAIRRVNSSGPPLLLSNIKITESVDRLKEANFSSEQSYFAGFYLCNAVLYESIHIIHHQTDAAKVGFVHLPQINDDENNWQLTELIEAITLIIKENIQ
ncbi:MAG: hypothetical protein R6U21_06840 [Thermoplasmatota archaeon]